jgi:hypothetical protein
VKILNRAKKKAVIPQGTVAIPDTGAWRKAPRRPIDNTAAGKQSGEKPIGSDRFYAVSAW